MSIITAIVQKSRAIVAASLVAAVIGVATLPFVAPVVSAASNCDKVSILYCGIDGGSAQTAINNFKATYAANKSGHVQSPTVKKDHTDLPAIYAWAGADAATIQSMNSENTVLGTLYRDGRIVVNGKTVGTDAWVTARFTNGVGFVQVTDGVWARKTTTSFENASAQVLVHMKNGQMTFAVMTICGNSVKATPVKVVTPPTPEKPVVTPPTPEKPVVTPPVVTPPAPEAPAELPQTGPTSVLGLAGGVSIAGASAHRLFAKFRRPRS